MVAIINGFIFQARKIWSRKFEQNDEVHTGVTGDTCHTSTPSPPAWLRWLGLSDYA